MYILRMETAMHAEILEVSRYYRAKLQEAELLHMF
jgi:hypothetical protein